MEAGDTWDDSVLSSDDELMEEGDKVQVKFVTKLEEEQWKAPESAYYVPLSLTRYGLSEVLNNLLQLEEPQPFDLMIDEKFLRTSLQRYVKTKNLSHEDVVIELEYVLALEAPKEKGECQHEDWISCLASPALTNSSYCCSGGYDGTVRFWTRSNEAEPFNFGCSLILSAHSKPIKDIQLFRSEKKECQVLTASQDFSVKWWKIKNVHKEQASSLLAARKDSLLGEFNGHTSAVESVTVAKTEEKFISGSFDGVMLAWDLTEDVEETLERDENEPQKKRKKMSPKRKPVLRMEEHVGCISALSWVSHDTCWSSSWDHSIRCWDLPTGICTKKMYGGTPIYDISVANDSPCLLSGHADRTIRLWDPRSKGHLVVNQYKSHKAWVPSVQWHPTNSNYFASASHDGTVKIWDLRSDFALHSIDAHDEKALCVAWHDNETILSGGADTKLKIHQFSVSTK